MFGYVRPPLDRMAGEDAARFRRVYCGLCHALGHRYGPAARWILNYDFTFLAILLLDGEGESRRRRCAVHPVHGREILDGDPSLDLAADESVILTYYQLRDGAEDSGPLRGLPYRMGSGAFSLAYHQAAARRPRFDRAVRERLGALRELEESRCASLDLPADAFASLLREAAPEEGDPVRRRVLGELLYHLGRWIYLIDAADDLKRDAAEGAYNPAALRYGLLDGAWTPEAKEAFAATLDHSVHRTAAAFELWDFGVWDPLLRETLYYGLFRVGRAVLDGTFHQAKKRKSI